MNPVLIVQIAVDDTGQFHADRHKGLLRCQCSVFSVQCSGEPRTGVRGCDGETVSIREFRGVFDLSDEGLGVAVFSRENALCSFRGAKRDYQGA
jgi:hypothetical protein